MLNYIHLPKRPGVYLFKDAQDVLLYIGKAISLYDRVRTYFHENQDRPNIKQLLERAVRVDFIETENEEAAFLLEAKLIQEQQPVFNVLLKDGQPFLYFYLDERVSPRRFLIVRNKKRTGQYIGPFLQKGPVRAAYNFLMREFSLSLCGKKIENGCLRYHLSLCAGDCKSDFDRYAYETRLTLAFSALQNNRELFAHMIAEGIAQSTKERAFERAQQLLYFKEQMDRIFSTIDAQGIFRQLSPEFLFTALNTPPQFSNRSESVAEELRNLCGGNKPISTIDCFDISHMQGQQIVGAVIHFQDGVAVPKKFRKFKIKTLTDQNDYAALQEIVLRHYKRAPLPDLILIDGGKGQLSAVKKLSFSTVHAALAKQEERLFTDQFPEGVVLSTHESIGKLLISLRDYTHHFAITYHRKRRTLSLK